MSPRTEEQFEQIREERKKQIMDVALEIIAEEGFSKVSIAKISEKAGISKGLMYNYFKSKEELIIGIMYAGIDEVAGFFDPKEGEILTKEEIHFFIDNIFKVFGGNIRFWRMYFMVMMQPEVYKIIEPLIMERLGTFMAMILNYFKQGNYQDPESEMRVFAALLDGIGLHYVLDPENYPLEGVKKILHNMYR